MSTSRYIIGIDLGTTNTAVAYVDTRSADQAVRVFEVPQLVAPGELARRRQLPSFVYLPGEHDLAAAETSLPWDDRQRTVVGELARSQGARVPGHMIASAKSWLCHSGVDRNSAILPWGAENVTKLSPVAVSALILRHVQETWDHVMANESDASFADQDVMVTVPASFDEAARELTLSAAEAAGFPSVVLLEEPQAAFYAWIESNPAGRRKKLLSAADTILVFDIGGGTTDFTLIRVGEDGESFERTAVGDHLLLGGDNIDLTLAKLAEVRLTEGKSKKLDSLQWHGLVHSCRLAKERILGDAGTDEVPISVAGRGSKLIGGAMKDAIRRTELSQILDDGFFPRVEHTDMPHKSRSGLQEFGLPYADDPAVTRHLASFLARHHVTEVDAVLFNGGAMTPSSLRQRMLDQIGEWQPDRGPPRELFNDLPEMAVARGAAYYGLVRRGLGARIRGGTPRAFFVGVGHARGTEADERGELAVCVAPKGLEEGSSVSLERQFELVCNRPVSFKLFSSSASDAVPGDLAAIGDGTPDMSDDASDLLELPPIVTVLRAPGRARANVRLEIAVTELGSLEIWCRDTSDQEHRWRLNFDMRAGGAAGRDDDAGELPEQLGAATQLIADSFRGVSDVTPQRLVKALETLFETRRDEWNKSTTRALFDAALKVENERKLSADHEARWLNLCGFCLRPGCGAPLDEWRVKQMWRIFNDGLAHPRSEACRLAWWIVWRRIAGGLSTGQQDQIYDRVSQLFLPSAKQKKKWHLAKPTKQEAAEMWRTLANLERLHPENKIRLGDELLRRMESKKGREEALHFWALGRLGGRLPLYGPLDCVVPASRAESWLSALLEQDWPDEEKAAFPMAQLARRTGDRARDLSDELRTRLATRLRKIPGGDRTARLVEEIVALEAREERVALGDTLPPGLRLTAD